MSTKFSVSIALLLMAVFSGSGARAEEAPSIKGDKVSVKGEIIDMWCYMEGGDKGAEHKKCAQACARAGNPIGILDEKGNVYTLMGGLKDHQAANTMLVEKMADTVTVDGTMVEKGGTKVIFVTAIK
jgi:hypothetical protein